MEKHIPTEKLQEALTAVGKYTIEMSKGNVIEHSETTKPTEKSCCSTQSHNHKKKLLYRAMRKGSIIAQCIAKAKTLRQGRRLSCVWNGFS